MPAEIRAHYRIVTPLFLGGPDQHCDGTLRPPSFKGALRFWWRALNWPHFRATTTDADALRKLHAEEARLFGSAANEVDGERSGGQGCFLLSVRPLKTRRFRVEQKGSLHRRLAKVEAARYLGYGLVEPFDGQNTKAGRLQRDCIADDQRFEVRLRFRERIEPSVVQALQALGLLGALGSRARHGMGSIALELLENGSDLLFKPPADRATYRSQVRALLGLGDDSPNPFAPIVDAPPFTAFSAATRIDDLLHAADPYAALDRFALALLHYRSWGQTIRGNWLPGKVVSEKRFQNDHDWFRVEGWRIKHPDFHPQRAVFGLPQNYSKHEKDQVTAEHFERRASALLLHVHPVGNEFLGITTFMPARFLPPGERIKAGEKSVPDATDWTIVTGLLDGTVGNPPAPDAAQRFPEKQEILP